MGGEGLASARKITLLKLGRHRNEYRSTAHRCALARGSQATRVDLDRNPPELMKKVELDGGEKGSSLNPTGSFYLSYGGLSDRLEGGMLLTTALPDYWSLDVGLGLAHQNGLDGTNPEESLNRQSAQLNYNE